MFRLLFIVYAVKVVGVNFTDIYAPPTFSSGRRSSSSSSKEYGSSTCSNVSSERRSKRPRCSARNTSYRINP